MPDWEFHLRKTETTLVRDVNDWKKAEAQLDTLLYRSRE